MWILGNFKTTNTLSEAFNEGKNILIPKRKNIFRLKKKGFFPKQE